MTNPVSTDIMAILEAYNFGTPGESIFIGQEPTEPDTCITIYDTGGGEQNPRFAIETAGFQIRLRSTLYLAGYRLLDRIKQQLEGRPPGTISGSRYIGYWATSNIIFLEHDESERVIFVLNFRIEREPSNTGWKQPV